MVTPRNGHPDDARVPEVPESPETLDSPEEREGSREIDRRRFLLTSVLGLAGLYFLGGCRKGSDEAGMEDGREYDLDEARFRSVARDIGTFFDCMAGRKSDGCALYDRYIRKAHGKDERVLRVDIFRDVLLEHIEDTMSLTKYESFMLHQNAYVFAHALNLLNVTLTGRQLAGGKKQISDAVPLLRAYASYTQRSAIAKEAHASEALEEQIDPLALLALIGAETDFVNFHNHREGVQGDFQFTSISLPKGTHYVPGDKPLSPLRARYNKTFDALDDIGPLGARKNIALCVAFLQSLEARVQRAFSRDDATDQNIRENYAFLLALTFYNSDIGKRINDPQFLRDVREQPSSFISHLNFTYGARAGKLYVPTIIVYYVLLREFEREGSTALNREDLILRAFEMCFAPNFGLKGDRSARRVTTPDIPEAPATEAPEVPPTPRPEPAAPRPTPRPAERPTPAQKRRIPEPVRHAPKPGSVTITVRGRLTKTHLLSAYFRSYDELYALNPSLRGRHLRTGQTLRLPSRYARTTVQPGDTLQKVAARAGCSAELLRTLNRLEDWDRWTAASVPLRRGETIIVPRSTR